MIENVARGHGILKELYLYLCVSFLAEDFLNKLNKLTMFTVEARQRCLEDIKQAAQAWPYL